MYNDILGLLNEVKDKIINSRLFILVIIYLFMIGILISRLFNLQIVNGETFLNNYIQKTEKTVSTPTIRGNIYDKNGNLLAYNELAYNVTIQDNGYYKTTALKNALFYKLVKILNNHKETIEGDLQIGLDDDGNYYYMTSSDAAKKRFLRDYYGLKSVDELDDEKDKYPSNISAADIIADSTMRYDLDQLKNDKGQPIILSAQEKLEIINIRYTMGLTSFQKYESTTISTDISDETKAEVLESSANLLGVNIEESTRRVYNDSIYFSSIIGYTGKMQENQFEELKKLSDDYTLSDIVGRIGVEEYMESTLKGTKGSKTMYVDNVGHIMETTNETPAIAGNDVYLTIDRDLQIGTYRLLEQQLAGIVASKLVIDDDPNPPNVASSNRKIPIKDAYYQLISNNVLDINKFTDADATTNEKGIYSNFLSYRDSTLDSIRTQLTGSSSTPMNALPEDMFAYMYYIYTRLSSDEIGIINTKLIDSNSSEAQAWKNDTISLRDFLYSGIANNWIDTTQLNIESKYSNADDIFNSMVDYIINDLKNNNSFDKMTYKYLIKNNTVTGRELCIALYDQGILNYDANEVNLLNVNGANYAFDFMVKKISDIEITPAQLALDPCTAGCVVTDVNTGEVRALVSYPGYDNNKLTNKMDTGYYNKLLADQSLPLYNNATQARKAPGSTFKPISAIAGLEEGVIGIYDTITCTGVYDTITPAIKCWIFPGAHGPLNVIGGLRNSCNYFFSEVGHRLSLNEKNEYDPALGIEKLRKYASMFGLDRKSGIEITETDPMMTTQNPEPSAIGQGTNSFANIQLARYVSAIANKGTVFDLSLINKTTDSSGNVLKAYEPNISSTVNIKESTWDAVQQGMREVVEYGSAKRIFNDLEVDIAGKTGTAEESKSRPNHAFFISFGPYSNPQIAVTVNIPYGYSSSNAAAVAKDVYRLYFGYTSLDNILKGSSLDVTDVSIGD